MESSQAVTLFAALAQETRLAALRALVKAGPEGLAAGKLAEAVGVSPSNLSFHLKELERAGLIVAQRKGTSIVYSPSFETLGALVTFLGEDCCAGQGCG